MASKESEGITVDAKNILNFIKKVKSVIKKINEKQIKKDTSYSYLLEVKKEVKNVK